MIQQRGRSAGKVYCVHRGNHTGDYDVSTSSVDLTQMKELVLDALVANAERKRTMGEQ